MLLQRTVRCARVSASTPLTSLFSFLTKRAERESNREKQSVHVFGSSVNSNGAAVTLVCLALGQQAALTDFP